VVEILFSAEVVIGCFDASDIEFCDRFRVRSGSLP
jgi:hypothetical protein